METQINEQFMGGTHAERLALVLRKIPELFVFYETDTTFAYIKVNDAWEPFPGALVNVSWPKYVVSNDPQIPTLYRTIDEAVAAIAIDGVFPATVLALPGTYNESVVLPAGVDIAALGTPGSVTIVGDVTVGGPMSQNQLSGITVIGTITFSGIGGTLTLTRCKVTAQAGNDAIVAVGTNAGSSIIALDSEAIASAPGVAARCSAPDACGWFSDGGLLATSPTTNAVHWSGAFDDHDTSIDGRVVIDGATSGLFLGAAIHTTAQECILLQNGANAELADGAALDRSDPGPLIDGVGQVSLSDTDVNLSQRISPTVQTTAKKRIRPYQSVIVTDPGPFMVTPDKPDVLECDSASIVPVTVTLASVLDFPDGSRWTIRRRLGSQTQLDVTPTPPDTIEGASMYSILTAPVTVSAGITIQADRFVQEWKIISS